jgi:hypothetical protein
MIDIQVSKKIMFRLETAQDHRALSLEKSSLCCFLKLRYPQLLCSGSLLALALA